MFDKYLQSEIKKEFSKEAKPKTDKQAIERDWLIKEITYDSD